MTFQEFLDRLSTAQTDDERARLVIENLLEQMPIDLRVITWAAVIPHWFNADILAALRPELKERATQLYSDLQKIIFVEVFPERGHTLHGLTRRLMLEQLWRDNPAEFRSLSARAVEFFAARDDDTIFRIEKTYHLIVSDPEKGADEVRNFSANLNNTFRFAELESLVNSLLEQVDSNRAAGRARGWALYRKGKVDALGYRMSDALDLFRRARGDVGEDKQLEANVLQAMGDVQQFRDERAAALQSYAHALELFRAVGDRLGEANALKAMGDAQQFRDERDTALQSYAHALELFRAAGSKLGEANVLQAMGDAQQARDERDTALQSYAHALELFRAVGSKLGEANVYAVQGELYVLSDAKRADGLLDQAIAIYQAIGSRYSVPAQTGNYGWKLLRMGEPERARPYLLRAAEMFEQMGLKDHAERHRAAVGVAWHSRIMRVLRRIVRMLKGGTGN